MCVMERGDAARIRKLQSSVPTMLNRRAYLTLLAACAAMLGQGTTAANKPADALPDNDWVCPMDPDYRSTKPGVCPRCGMKLVLGIPDRIEYPLEVSQSPKRLTPNENAVLTLRAMDPRTHQPVRHFDIVHERLLHLFVISENLQYFAHIHPTLQSDGSFRQQVCLPYGGMYRLLADFYPSGAVPQLALGTIFVSGKSSPPSLAPMLAPSKGSNLTASLQLDPEQPLAGLETRLSITLHPADNLQPYLGAWAHMLAVSEDLIDLIHMHPFLANGGPTMQFNIVFPRPGLYRVWTQVQRQNVVNTTAFTIPVRAL